MNVDALPGRVVFVGAGPGAADLLTLRGAQRLAAAEVVLADALIDPRLRTLAPRARWLDVGKRGHAASTPQADIDALLVALARRHARVVRLKGGDPSVFGRLEEELLALAGAGIDAEIVPGVTAACAAAADAARPLTRRGRGRSVALCTAATADGPPALSRAADTDTEVHYMAGRRLSQLQRTLRAAGWPPDAAVLVVSRAGWPDSLATTHRLDALAAAALLHRGRPTVATVGVGATPLTGSAALAGAAPGLRAGLRAAAPPRPATALRAAVAPTPVSGPPATGAATASSRVPAAAATAERPAAVQAAATTTLVTSTDDAGAPAQAPAQADDPHAVLDAAAP